MKLNSISLRHAHHFSDLNIEFKYSDKPITLILGDQSSGKTAILKNIYQSLTWFSARFKDARTAGVVMPDSDITFNRVQSRIDIQIQIPDEIGTLPESTTSEEKDVKQCAWRLYKTIQANGVGFSKVDTLQLEQTIQLYHKALAQDPLLGLPMIAYYPSDRFVNDINLISKNNPAVFQNHSAYELVVLPYTTFARFFEWFREICDIENAQAANLFQQILIDAKEIKSTDQITVDHDEKNVEFAKSLFQAHAQLHSPSLNALKTAINIVIPEITDLYLEYQPKLQLMVCYNNQDITYQQLSNSIKNWIALVGDIVRRLSLLNPNSLFPCLEGNGILLIDSIDAQLDQNSTQIILTRLNQAFPNIQIIASGTSTDLLENAEQYQYLKLENKHIEQIDLASSKISMDTLYQNLLGQNFSVTTDVLPEPDRSTDVEKLFEHFQNLSLEQQQELMKLLGDDDRLSKAKL